MLRWFKKFYLQEPQESDMVTKTVDSEVVFQAIEANLVSSIQRVSGDLNLSQCGSSPSQP